MKTTISTIPELKNIRGIKFKDIEKVIAKQTYYNLLAGKPYQKNTKIKLCELFKIDQKTFDKLLKKTLKLNK